MSQPPDKYDRIFDFTDFSAMQPSAQQPGQKIDQELNAARVSINETIDRLNEIQRDDGKLRATAVDTSEFQGIVDAATATATAAATSAATSATTATTKAGEATASATTASNAATTATGASASAQAQATIASAAATTATTKATEASNSAAAALASQTSATASAATATTKAAEASGSAATAATQASNAQNSANTSSAQANLATAAAVAAGNSASTASAQAIAASNSASAASGSASAAASSASLATTKANAASSSASAAAASAASIMALDPVEEAPTDGNEYVRKDAAWQIAAGGDFLPLAGGSMDVNAEITLSDGSVNSEVGGWGFGVQETATPATYATVEPTGFTATTGEYVSFVNPGVVRVERIEGNEGISLGWNGIQFYDSSVQTTAYPGGVENKRDLTDYNFTNVADTKLATFGMTIQPPTSEDPSIYNSFLDADELKLEVNTSEGGTVPGYLYRSTVTLSGMGVLGQTWTDQDGEIVTSGPSSVSINYLGITFPNASVQTIAFPGFNNVALTGTPTAVTQSPGNNTTALATTAFVTASNPDASTTTKGHVELATNAETVAGTSTTRARTPAANYGADKKSGHSFVQFNILSASTSGTGATAGNSAGGHQVAAPTSAVGYGCGFASFPAAQRGINRGNGSWNWAKAFTATFRYSRNSTASDSNSISRVTFGKNTFVGGDPTVCCVGIRMAGSNALQLIVHNGTTLTAVTTTSSIVPTVPITLDIRITSDGAGNVSLFVNDVLEATTSAGPTGTSGTSASSYIVNEAQNAAIITGTAATSSIYNLHFEFAD